MLRCTDLHLEDAKFESRKDLDGLDENSDRQMLADAGRLFCFGSGTACRNFRIGRPKVGKTKAFWAGLASAPASGCSGTFGPGMLY